MRPSILCPAPILLLGALGCGGSGSSTVATSAPAPIPLPRSVDCVPGAPGCAELKVQGDPYATLADGSPSPFDGYADPSLRRDPLSGDLWLAYSYPHFRTVGGQSIPAVEIHLARSGDGGATFQTAGPLWPALPTSSATDPAQAGLLYREVANLLPVQAGGGTTWYAARLEYFLARDAASDKARPEPASFRIQILQAPSPTALATALPQSLGAAATLGAWGVDQNLSALSPDLADVGLWNEPALAFENGTLYLALVGFVYDGNGQPNMARHRVHLFATTPTGPSATWRWSYRGVLAGAAEAAELGAQRLSQIDFARAQDGSLLLLCSPDDWVPSLLDYNHKGCKVLQVASLASPALLRDAAGKLVVRASLGASDAGALGSASACSEPGSSTGILFTRRTKTATAFTSRVWRTSLTF